MDRFAAFPALRTTDVYVARVIAGDLLTWQKRKETYGHGKRDKRPIHIAKETRDLFTWQKRQETYSHGKREKRPIHMAKEKRDLLT